MTYNILVSHPLKMPLTHAAGPAVIIYYGIINIILFCTKPAYLTARAWPSSIDFNGNNFGCGTKKRMQAGDGKLLHYKLWPNVDHLLHDLYILVKFSILLQVTLSVFIYWRATLSEMMILPFPMATTPTLILG